MKKITLAPIEINPATQGLEIGVDVEIPPGFDAATFPILAEHWFGVSPAAVCVEAVAQAV